MLFLGDMVDNVQVTDMLTRMTYVVLVLVLATPAQGYRHLSQRQGRSVPSDFVFPKLTCDKSGPFPYVVSLRTTGNRHYCGGVLVSPNAVATAASCVDVDPYPTIYIGGFDIHSPIEIKNTLMSSAHPDWNGFSQDGNDIAVLRMDSPTCVAPIPSIGGPVLTGQNTTYLGFGRTSVSGPFSTDLLFGEFTTQAASTCTSNGAAPVGTGAVSTFCTRGPGGNGGLCEGDEGGPAIFRPSTAVFQDQLVGIASYVSGSGSCSDPSTYGVFTNVKFFYSWLRSQL